MTDFRTELGAKTKDSESVVFDFQLDSVERLLGVEDSKTGAIRLMIGRDEGDGKEVEVILGEDIIAWKVLPGVEEREWVDQVLFGKAAEVQYIEFVTKNGPVDVRVPKVDVDRVSVELENFLAPYVDEEEMESIRSSRSSREKHFPLFPPLFP